MARQRRGDAFNFVFIKIILDFIQALEGDIVAGVIEALVLESKQLILKVDVYSETRSRLLYGIFGGTFSSTSANSSCYR